MNHMENKQMEARGATAASPHGAGQHPAKKRTSIAQSLLLQGTAATKSFNESDPRQGREPNTFLLKMSNLSLSAYKFMNGTVSTYLSTDAPQPKAISENPTSPATRGCVAGQGLSLACSMSFHVTYSQ